MAPGISDNLCYYLSQAVLPEMQNGINAPAMPSEGHKSHRNNLAVRPEPYRKLQSIYQIKEPLFKKLVLEWIDDYVPQESLGIEDEDRATGERLSIPAEMCCDIPPMPLMRPSEISRVSVWVDQLPLATVQRAIHLVYPHTRDWKFVHNEVVDIDEDIFRHIEWRDWRQPQSTRLILVLQPPWILSPQDMHSFRNCRMFPMSNEPSDPKFDSEHRLWGKLWDLCVRRQCPRFVVTTYNGWVFGAFSHGWTTGFVSPVFKWDDEVPTVVEVLTYWTTSSMGLPGAWDIPMVREIITNLNPNLSIPLPNENRFSPAPSESSWARTSQTAPSSAGFTASPVLSDAGLPGASSSQQSTSIQDWVVGAQQHNLGTLLSPPSPSGTLSSEWSELTADAKDYKYNGDWMSMSFRQQAVEF